ncbi:diguanylate cyclase [Paenibacillus hexagrammi]|uniref:GGDEF domain-containing protein n=1 Tax=Paenibacillus hexagrammi TaxID=2908839 RepID=A0ABY3SL02_9BACL|nr:diguanylate cyclase [Paenibacillus sp. YPD9-1]UJF34065.1 GGDEF domain-containing protein [Paenibacillus sp. YPD9-1]
MEDLPVNDHNWNKKLIRIFWWIFFIYEVAAAFGFIVIAYQTPDQWLHGLLRFQVLPSCLQLLLMAAGYISLHTLKRYSDFIMILWATTMVTIYILCIPELTNKYELMCIPIVLSSIYFQKKHIIFAYSSSIIYMTAMIAWNMTQDIYLTMFEAIIYAAIVTATAFVCFAIMDKGHYIINQLKDSIVREQELLVRSVMVDRMSKIDALTDLFNHRSFQEHTDHLISHLSSDTSLELALMDIDNFKKINDTYGHWIGDEVLKTIGSIVKETLSADDMAFRYGGEELAPYNRSMLKKAWFQHVDECLYSAKRCGKNRIHSRVFD